MAPQPDREPGQHDLDEQRVKELANAARRDRRLDPAEHDRLLEAAARGDQDARESLTKVHLDWVISAAEERADRGLSQGDLFQEGTIGLMEAIQTFSADGHEDFESFARGRVALHMDRAIGEEEKVVRDGEMLLQAARDYAEAELAVRRDLGRPGSNVEIAQKLEWSARRAEEMGQMVADARRRHDEEVLRYLEPDDIDQDSLIDDRHESDDG